MTSRTDSALVSVIMPAYNAQATLADSAHSVLQQSYSHLELLIINDRSTDGTAQLMESLAGQDPRVRLIHQENNAGVAQARNAGIQAAQGKYIAFLDSDDLWMPDKLERQLALMQEQGCLACMSAYHRFQVPGQWLGTSRPPARTNYKKLLKGNVIGNLTGIYDCEKLGKVYQQPVRHEDYLMWLEIARKAGDICAVPAPLAAYRVGHSSLSSNKLKSIQWTWDIYHRHLGLSAPRSGYLMLHYLAKAVLKRL
ncbi:glycosyltransferase family 2 protein [Alcaligenes sp. WGS1538]|uniref:glycosyltransferase family 2 protein n=1 Tax=Alcaligenes sp. WGS1538 TaxID=3366811 RepID=UPI00229127B6|nr:glycosyltransferase family 2 protein [Escherichia coli]